MTHWAFEDALVASLACGCCGVFGWWRGPGGFGMGRAGRRATVREEQEVYLRELVSYHGFVLARSEAGDVS
jgi:hypothetical protein